MILYILPHQLFDIKVKNVTKCILWEHPQYYTKYKFNKKKLVLHRASMKFYYDRFLKNHYTNVQYINFDENHIVAKNSLLFDPIDVLPEFKHSKIIESPNFLLTKEQLENIFSEQKKTMRFTQSFFKKAKKLTNILVDIDSTDKQNRVGKIPNSVAKLIKPLPTISNPEKLYIKDSIEYVEKHFKNNYGNTKNFNYPISRKQASLWLTHFEQNSFKQFGTYQDAILNTESYMFHSILSSSINIGLLNPTDIMSSIYLIKTKIPINSYEAYVRQLFWREYQRYNYIFNKDHIEKPKLFNFTNQLKKEWYDGTTGVLPIDKTIRKAFDTAYLHHIERLMILGNYMVLNKIDSKEAFKWFMEFSIDSYEWVMLQNVYDMVFFNSNGMTTSKLYITSSKYIDKMTDFEKDGKWSSHWDNLYKNFKKEHFINRYKYKK